MRMRAQEAAALGLHSNQELQRAHCPDTRRSGRGRASRATADALRTPLRLRTVSTSQLVSTWLQKHPAHVQGSPSAQAQTTGTRRWRRPASAEAAKTSAGGPAGAREQQQAGKGLPCQNAGAKQLPPVKRGKNTRVLMLQSCPRCARAFRRTCKAVRRISPQPDSNSTLGCAATPKKRRRAHLAPAQHSATCARANQRGQRNKRRENGTGGGALTRSLSTSAPAARVSVH
jgi:hypothetical protein